MKKFFMLVLVAFVSLSLVACGTTTGTQQSSDGDASSEVGEVEVDKILFEEIDKENVPNELVKWNENHEDPMTESAVIDGSLYIVVSSGMKPTAGHGIVISNVVRQNDDLYVYYYETSPEAGTIVAEVLTYPKQIIKVHSDLQNIVYEKVVHTRTPSDSISDTKSNDETIKDPNKPVSNEVPAPGHEDADEKEVNTDTKAERAQETELTVYVEGMEDKRHAVLKNSDEQNFSMYLLERFTLESEEPGKDILISEYDQDFFVRIERLGNDVDVEQIKKNIKDTLLENVKVHDLDPKKFYDSYYHSAEFYLLVETENEGHVEVNVIHMVKSYDGEYFKFMFHLPQKEAQEGINPSFYAMLKTIKHLHIN